MNPLLQLDAALSRTRPAWGWLGEVALVAIGVHHATDQLDDRISEVLTAFPAWPDPDGARITGTWTALSVELWAVGWALGWAAYARAEPARDLTAWRARASVPAVVVPLLWLPAALSGSWGVALTAEDALSPPLGALAGPAAWTLGALVAWRFGLPGVARVTRRMPPPPRWWMGLPGGCVALPLAWLVVRHGLPLWAWLE